MRKFFTIKIAIFLTILGIGLQLQAATIFVKSDAVGNSDGTSWADAYTTIYEALDNVSDGDDVWVAAGTYYATANDSEEDSLGIPGGVGLYGGFAGTETILSQRDIANNETIVSGEIGDTESDNDNTEHIFELLNATEPIVLDGFTIVESYCSGAGCNGGGIFIKNCTQVYIKNCTFQDNYATSGAGIKVEDTDELYIANSKFLSNQTSAVGTVYFEDTPGYVVNCLFYDNGANGGAAIFAFQSATKLNIVNSTIAYNAAGNSSNAGAISSSAEATVYLSNSIVWGNTLFSTEDVELSQVSNYAESASTYVSFSIIEGYTGTGVVTGKGKIAGTNISSEDPLFAGEAEDMLYLQDGSPAIDAGVNDSIPDDLADIDADGNTAEMLGLDLLNNIRIFDNTKEVVDLGAYESIFSGGEFPLSLDEMVEELSAYTIFPNPTAEQASVEFTLNQSTPATLYVTDLQGKVIEWVMEEQSLAANTYNVKLGDLPVGTYLVALYTLSGVTTKLLQVVD